MNRKVLVLTILMIVAMMSTPLIPTVQARITEENRYGPPDFPAWFTEHYGTLGGANFFVLVPDDWTNPLGNGMLVILCRPAGYQEDPRDNLIEYGFAKALVSQGFAVAMSSWGTPEKHGVKEGVIRTHQLTMYVIDNYDVTGKVFLFGSSGGGAVALLLGERHPDIYSGVLDNSGVKDWAYLYNTCVTYPGFDLFLLLFFGGMKNGLENTYGGTPEERPNKYAKDSPIHHADMAIPVISVVHVGDVCVEPTQTDLYHAALSDPSLHMVVTVTEVTPGGLPVPGATGWYGHFDPATFAAAAANLINLIIWSNTLP